MDSNGQTQPVLVIPCSGVGKVHGLISREAVYQVTDQLLPEQADTVCLALLVTGDAETKQKVQQTPCITLDGCPKLCAFKNVELSGGKNYQGDTGLRRDETPSRCELRNRDGAEQRRLDGGRRTSRRSRPRRKATGHGLREQSWEKQSRKSASSPVAARRSRRARWRGRRFAGCWRPCAATNRNLVPAAFLAGEEGERRFAREHPTITVDGCSKLCAKRGTEQYSGQVSASLVVADILGRPGQRMPSLDP